MAAITSAVPKIQLSKRKAITYYNDSFKYALLIYLFLSVLYQCKVMP
ncbi:MAG: hypothetical protein ACFWTN_00885 [Clostridium sp.]|jgi:hypothetical protein